MIWLTATDTLPIRPQRIIVAGSSGSGKSTLARGIARVLEIDHVELDGLYHGPDWTPNPDFDAAVAALAARPAWVAEWQYSSARARLADRADLLVWLDLPRHVVMRGVVRRTIRRRRHDLELWNGNREPPLRTILTDRDHIIRWAWRTHSATGPRVRAALDDRPDLAAVVLHSRREAADWLAGPVACARDGRRARERRGIRDIP